MGKGVLHLFFVLFLASTTGCGVVASSLDRIFGGELAAIAKVYEVGDPKTAAERLKVYLAKKPRDDLAWTILGNASMDLGQNDAAEAAFQKALDINPNRFEAVTGMGILSRKNGDNDKAMAYYRQALAIDPKYAQAYSSMAVISLMRSQDKEALEYARKAYDLDRSNPDIAANLAVAYHYNGMFELRDMTTEEAQRLGYTDGEKLRKIYSGELTLRE